MVVPGVRMKHAILILLLLRIRLVLMAGLELVGNRAEAVWVKRDHMLLGDVTMRLVI